jgi:predicted RNA-binding protein with PIN domain
MSSHVVIDGYNLLGVRGQVGRGPGASGEAARERLIQQMALYRQQRGHMVTVVFDGWQQGGILEHRESRNGVQVVYSARGERADQVIQRLAEEYGRDCAVVSSDRQVADSARLSGAFVMSAVEFEAKLRGPAAPQVSGRPAHLGKDRGEDADLPRRSEKKGNPRRLPKALRQRNRQLRGF